MIKNPLVSIIIPCFNSGATIDRTIDSIESQTWKDFEIIIINDGSTEKLTIDKLSQISTNKNITLINQPNLGLASARNTGIAAADGSYVMPLDADDWLEPDALTQMLLVANDEGPNVIVYSDMKLQGDRTGLKKTFCNPFEQLFSNQLPYCMLFPRNTLTESGGYDRDFVLGFEDWELNLRIIRENYRFHKIEKELFNYSVSKSGMLKSKSLKNFYVIFAQIRSKNIDSYRIINLITTRANSKQVPSKRKLLVYLLIELAYRALPKRFFRNFLNLYFRLLK
jgi:glycosyltransferase involved in cell wall biosynthesis